MSLDVYHWAVVCSLLCGGGSFCVNKSFGLEKAVCTESLIHHLVVEFIIDYFCILKPFVVGWNILYVSLGDLDKNS